eukprot:2559633-Rhodomonas_salina.1
MDLTKGEAKAARVAESLAIRCGGRKCESLMLMSARSAIRSWTVCLCPPSAAKCSGVPFVWPPLASTYACAEQGRELT